MGAGQDGADQRVGYDAPYAHWLGRDGVAAATGNLRAKREGSVAVSGDVPGTSYVLVSVGPGGIRVSSSDPDGWLVQRYSAPFSSGTVVAAKEKANA